MDSIHELSIADLRTLAEALKMGRLSFPISSVSISRYCPNGDSASIAETLQNLGKEGATAASIASMLLILADAKMNYSGGNNAVDLVWTGPETPEAPSRDTAVVVRELFASACEHVLVAGYAVYQGKEVFRVLAERMEALPSLQVDFFLDVQRGHKETTITEDIIRRFMHRFTTNEWPGLRFPDIYYDPRALEKDRNKKACLHAKCIVIDRAVAFVSSANFTEAAQNRNIEVGALIRSRPFAERLVSQFQSLVAANLLDRMPTWR